MSLSLSILQQRLITIRNNKFFEAFVITIIIVSALVIGARTYEIDLRYQLALGFFDNAITVFFLVEILIRMAAEKRLTRFFRQGWNVFDFIVVTVSLIPIEGSEMAFLGRLLRIFRLLRLISIVPELRILLNSLVIAIPRMGYVALLMFIIFYIYGAIGSILFQDINEQLWGDISIAMLTLFRVATFEDWTDVMYETMNTYKLSWIYYLSFIFLTAFIFLNMMIGIILDVMQKEHEKYNREQGEGEAGEVHWLREHSEVMEGRLQRIEEMLAGLHETKRTSSQQKME